MSWPMDAEVRNISFAAKKTKLIYGRVFEDYISSIKAGNIIVITDENVSSTYRSRYWPSKVIVIGTGEDVKNLATVKAIYSRLLDYQADRFSYIIGIGGGIVCDIAGFAASTFQRGLRLGFVPTTLLAQVDASIGGKNGVNFERQKNYIGTFYQPEFILFDTKYLRTLDKKQILCGIAESIKHSLIGSPELLALMEKEYEGIKGMDDDTIRSLIDRSSAVKIDVVEKDEKETGIRRILNFGHTFGHAIEMEYGLSHGEAVALGMVISLKMSVKKGYMNAGLYDRIIKLFGKYNIQTDISVDKMKIIRSIERDKKKEDKFMHFVFLRDISSPALEKIRLKELEELYLCL